MKQLMLCVLSAGILLCCSCTNTETKMSSQAQKNLDACKIINNAIETGDVSKLDQAIAADAVDHAGMTGDIKGLDSIKASLVKIHTWADMKTEVIKELADDEYVFQWVRFKGTAKTTDMGLPVGGTFDLTAIEVSKFKDGKAVEHWEFMQPSDMMKMMEPQTGPGTDIKGDTTGMKLTDSIKK